MDKHTQTIRRLLPTSCLSVFDHFVEFALKGLSEEVSSLKNIFHFILPAKNFIIRSPSFLASQVFDPSKYFHMKKNKARYCLHFFLQYHKTFLWIPRNIFWKIDVSWKKIWIFFFRFIWEMKGLIRRNLKVFYRTLIF